MLSQFIGRKTQKVRCIKECRRTEKRERNGIVFSKFLASGIFRFLDHSYQ